ncbi:MAG TPA: hypothetical protein PL196_06105, partial [Burkholderiaceae bacterium]|nr:hypothetical protein [Burkholderiaceae bacterium]
HEDRQHLPCGHRDGRDVAAAEGSEFLRPVGSSAPLEAAHALLRERVARFERDRFFAPEIERATALVRVGTLARVFRALPGLPALWTPA